MWVADITYIRVRLGFVYLAVVLDAFSRKVVGYALSKSREPRLTLSALEAAMSVRRPKRGCIHHSDRGVQGEFKGLSQRFHATSISSTRRAPRPGFSNITSFEV